MIVKFKTDKEGFCLTTCPLGTIGLSSDQIHVSSLACQRCKNFRGFQSKSKIICEGKKDEVNMKLILRDKYEGLDPELAQALDDGKLIEGVFYDARERRKGWLAVYCPDSYYKFRTSSGEGYRNFTPSQLKEIDWSKVPVDTLIGMNLESGELFLRYFKCIGSGFIYAFDDGKTSQTSLDNKATAWDISIYKFKIIEYPCNCDKKCKQENNNGK